MLTTAAMRQMEQFWITAVSDIIRSFLDTIPGPTKKLFSLFDYIHLGDDEDDVTSDDHPHCHHFPTQRNVRADKPHSQTPWKFHRIGCYFMQRGFCLLLPMEEDLLDDRWADWEKPQHACLQLENSAGCFYWSQKQYSTKHITLKILFQKKT